MKTVTEIAEQGRRDARVTEELLIGHVIIVVGGR